MNLSEQLSGKWHAARTLASQIRYLSNWRDVFGAYRKNKPLPPLKLRNGVTVHHRPADPSWSLFEEIFVHRCYTQPGFYTPRANDCVMDLGANIGLFALFLQTTAPGVKVHCFEPSSSTRAQLEENVAANSFTKNITIHPFAIMNKTETRTLHRAEMSGSNSFFLENRSGGEEVKCITLADAIKACGVSTIDLLKIDTEGAELEILDGVNADTFGRIKRVVLEYHEDVRPGCLKELHERLAPHFPKIKSWKTSPDGLLGVMQAWR